MNQSTTDSDSSVDSELSYGIDSAEPGGDETALTIRHGKNLYVYVGDEAEVILALIAREKQEAIEAAKTSIRIMTKCPSCKRTSLIIAGGNYLVCGNLECKYPDAIDRLANQPTLKDK